MNKKTTIEEAFWAIGVNDAPEVGHRLYGTASLLYDRAVNYVLQDRRWSFATRSIVLPARAAMCAGNLRDGLMAELPDDCVALIKCSAENYELEGRSLFFKGKGKAKITLTYLSNETLAAQMSSDTVPYSALVPLGFLESVKYKLAVLLAMPITANMNMMAAMEGKYEQERAKALLADVRQYGGNNQRPDPLARAEGNHPYYS